MIMPTLSDAPARAAKITISAEAEQQGALGADPTGDELVKNIARPVTSR